MEEELSRRLDKITDDLGDIKSELAIIKEWKTTVSRYTQTVWVLIVAFIAKTLGVHYE